MKTLWTYYFSLLFNTSHILRLRTMKCQLNFIFFFFFFSFFLFFAELIELYLYLKEISLRHVWQWHRKYIKTFGFSQNHRMFISLYQKSWTQKKKKFSNCKEPKYIYIYIYLFCQTSSTNRSLSFQQNCKTNVRASMSKSNPLLMSGALWLLR